jgi:two-component system response regulator NreC
MKRCRLFAGWLKGVRDGDAKKIKVIVAEEHEIALHGLISLLRGVKNIEVVEEARDGAEIVQQVEQLRPDAVLIDPSIRGKSGLSAAKEIKKRFPETKVLVLTTYDSEDYIRAAFKAGADGYCLKDCGLQDLVIAIKSVLAGKVYFSPSISDKILDGYLRPHKPTRVDLLTHREKEILKLLGEGNKNREIAYLLSISDKTAAKHKSNIMRKLDCHTTSDLTVFAIQVDF